jgi:hypothetical protein
MTRNQSIYFARSSSSVLVRALLTVAVIAGVSVGVAQAGYIGNDLALVTMSDSQGRTASAGIANPFANLPPQAQVPPFVREMISERFELRVGDDILGWIDSLGVELIGDPVASINFVVTAGGSDVTVTVSSATVTFPALNNPAASAEAEITLTDNGGTPATIDPLSGNNGLFRAIYNGTQEYASLLGSSSIGGGSVTFSEDTSGPIGGSVSSIRAEFAFELSAGDTASGTGTFTVVPEPTSVGLAICAFVALIASKRRRRSL